MLYFFPESLISFFFASLIFLAFSIIFLLNSIIVSDPITNEFGFSTETASYFVLVGVIFSIIGGILWGYIVDIFGPKKTLNFVLCLWFIDFTIVISLALFVVPYEHIIIWSGAALAGISISGVWAADRPYMLVLSPPKHLGQFYGL